MWSNRSMLTPASLSLSMTFTLTKRVLHALHIDAAAWTLWPRDAELEMSAHKRVWASPLRSVRLPRRVPRGRASKKHFFSDHNALASGRP